MLLWVNSIWYTLLTEHKNTVKTENKSETEEVNRNTHTIVLLLFWNLPGTTRVSRYQKGKTNLDLLEQEIVSGSGICWAICKSAPCPRQPRQYPTTQFFTGRMPFLPPNQQRQSTEGKKHWREEALVYLWGLFSQVFDRSLLYASIMSSHNAQTDTACASSLSAQDFATGAALQVESLRLVCLHNHILV